MRDAQQLRIAGLSQVSGCDVEVAAHSQWHIAQLVICAHIPRHVRLLIEPIVGADDAVDLRVVKTQVAAHIDFWGAVNPLVKPELGFKLHAFGVG